MERNEDYFRPYSMILTILSSIFVFCEPLNAECISLLIPHGSKKNRETIKKAVHIKYYTAKKTLESYSKLTNPSVKLLLKLWV